MRKILLAALVALPVPVFAQTLLDTLYLISTFLNAAVGLFITLAILVFFWSLIRYLASSSMEEKSKMVRTMMMGVLSLFVMVSIWGIIRLMQNTFKVTSTEPVVPQGIEIGEKYY